MSVPNFMSVHPIAEIFWFWLMKMSRNCHPYIHAISMATRGGDSITHSLPQPRLSPVLVKHAFKPTALPPYNQLQLSSGKITLHQFIFECLRFPDLVRYIKWHKYCSSSWSNTLWPCSVWQTNTPVWGLALAGCPLNCNILLLWNSYQMFTVSFPGNRAVILGKLTRLSQTDSDLCCLLFPGGLGGGTHQSLRSWTAPDSHRRRRPQHCCVLKMG